MNPAWSVIFLTVAAGAAQGLLVALALGALGGIDVAPGALGGIDVAPGALGGIDVAPGALGGIDVAPGGLGDVGAEPGSAFASTALLLAAALLVIGLAASFFHLGRPERAWRAAAMWRTSWLSREVLVLPAVIAVAAMWWLALRIASPPALTRFALPLVALFLCALLWLCTAKIYACLTFVEEWAHPLTFVNFVSIGLSSGFLLAAALGALFDPARWLAVFGPAALVATVAAGVLRALAFRRNARLRHRSSLQSATGIASPRLVQISMGMSAGSFNTREFFHGVSRAALARIRLFIAVFAFALPALLVVFALVATDARPSWPWVIAVASQIAGLVADRWLFFAEAKHPQNLYYQVVS